MSTLLLASFLSAMALASPLIEWVGGGEAPPRPVWPTEWSATLTQLNLTTNETGQFECFYSLAHNATVSHFQNADGSVFDDVRLFSEGKELHMWEGQPNTRPVCVSSALEGEMEVMPVEGMVFNGTVRFLGEDYWFWIAPPLGYATEQTAEQWPKLYLDAEKSLLTVWTNFTEASATEWPIGLFEEPAACA